MNDLWKYDDNITDHLIEFSTDQLLQLYNTMVTIRLFEERVADLVAAGHIKTPCHLYIGQEAVSTGICASLNPEDMVFSTHRSHGHYLAKGGNLNTLMAEIFCRISGCSRGKGGSMHIADPEMGLPGSSAIVAGTIPLAIGAALGFQIKGLPNVSVAFFGDGATNEGIFYESINLASLKKLPVIFVCENNLYSTHLPSNEIQADPELHRKGSVFHLPGVRIDGNDIGEVYTAGREAIERARKGLGPTLIECMTYRWRGHVGPNWDIEKGLRTQEELDWWMDRCCIKRYREYLVTQNILSVDKDEEIIDTVKAQIEEAIQFAQSSPVPSNDELVHFVYKERTDLPMTHISNKQPEHILDFSKAGRRFCRLPSQVIDEVTVGMVRDGDMAQGEVGAKRS